MTDIAEGLGRFLGELWREDVAIENLDRASAGARRHNLLFEVVRGDERLPLVATILPTPDMEETPMDVEAEVLRIAERAEVPAPRIVAVTTDPTFVGGPMFITHRIVGESIPRRILRLVDSNPGLGDRLAFQCGEALARLHAFPTAGMDPRIERPDGGDPALHAVAELRSDHAELPQPSAPLTLALTWLERNSPTPPEQLSLVHGDLRNGNIAVDSDGLVAAYDWEIAHLGDPMEDLAWLCVRAWRFRQDHKEVGGFASREPLFRGYEEAGGTIDLPRFRWWKLLRTVWWGLGLAKQAAGHLDGSFRSIVMAASGRRVSELEYDTLMLLKREYQEH